MNNRIFQFFLCLLLTNSMSAQFTDITPPGTFGSWSSIHKSSAGDIFLSSRDTTANTFSKMWIYSDSLRQLTDEVKTVISHREFADGSIIFGIKDTTDLQSLYLYTDDTLMNITPTGSFTILTPMLIQDNKEITYVGQADTSTLRRLYYGVAGMPLADITPSGDFVGFQFKYVNALGHVLFQGQLSITHSRKIFYFDGVTLFDLGVPEDNAFTADFETAAGVVFFIATENTPLSRALYQTNGPVTNLVTPDSSAYRLMNFLADEDDQDRLLSIEDGDGSSRLYRILRSNGAITDRTPPGSWEEIEYVHENSISNHNDFVTFKKFGSDSLFLYRISSAVVDLTGNRYWTEVEYMTNCQDDEIFKVKNGDTGTYDLYKNENGTMIQFMNLGFDQILNAGDTLVNGQDAFRLLIASSQNNILVTCSADTLVDRSPPGSWSDIDYLGFDSEQLMYFSFEDAVDGEVDSLFVWNGLIYKNISLPGGWHTYRKLLYHPDGAQYFEAEGLDFGDISIFKYDGDSSQALSWLNQPYGDALSLKVRSGEKSFIYGPVPSDTSAHKIYQFTSDGEYDVTPMGDWSFFTQLIEKPDGTSFFDFRQNSLATLWRFDNYPKNDPCNAGHLFAFEDPIMNGTYQAHQYVYSEGKVPSGGNVTFVAGDGILLKPGLEIGMTADFSVNIGNCPE